MDVPSVSPTYIGEKPRCVALFQPQGSNSALVACGSYDSEETSVTLFELKQASLSRIHSIPLSAHSSEPRDVVGVEIKDGCVWYCTQQGHIGRQQVTMSGPFQPSGDVQRTVVSEHVLTSMCLQGDMAVLGTEDGTLVVKSIGAFHGAHSTLGERTGIPITAVAADQTSSSNANVIALTATGRLQIWDLRSSSQKPVKASLQPESFHALTCMDCHPTNPTSIVTGASDGSIATWDLRSIEVPVSIAEAHSGSVNAVSFHPFEPQNLFSGGDDGRVLHWKTQHRYGAFSLDDEELDVTDLIASAASLPIRDLATSRDTVVAASDNQALLALSGLSLR